MDNKLAYQQLHLDVRNSSKIVIALLLLSAFGILAGISGFVFSIIYVYIPGFSPVFIFITSVVLMLVSYIIYRNTRNLLESLERVNV
jgi:ABC-type polysaccharide/polyol phosphate export permease